jgi:glucan phosphoethanolaminetransferase (alkaline phosphatase superfamily)
LVGSDKAEFFSLVFIIVFSLYSVSPDTAVQAGIQSNCVTDYIFVSFFWVALQICFNLYHNTMRTNLLNWNNLVSISKNVVFYAFGVVRILLIFGKF